MKVSFDFIFTAGSHLLLDQSFIQYAPLLSFESRDVVNSILELFKFKEWQKASTQRFLFNRPLNIFLLKRKRNRTIFFKGEKGFWSRSPQFAISTVQRTDIKMPSLCHLGAQEISAALRCSVRGPEAVTYRLDSQAQRTHRSVFAAHCNFPSACSETNVSPQLHRSWKGAHFQVKWWVKVYYIVP